MERYNFRIEYFSKERIQQGRILSGLLSLFGLISTSADVLFLGIAACYLMVTVVWFYSTRSGLRTGSIKLLSISFAMLELLYITFLVYITGNVFSCLILAYPLALSVNCLHESKRLGFLSALMIPFLYMAMNLLIFRGWLKEINILTEPSHITPSTLLLSSFSVIALSIVCYRIMTSLNTRVRYEIQLGQRTETRLNKDLTLARKVQQNLLPNPTVWTGTTEFTFDSSYLALENVGGDLYDVIALSSKKYGFLMADVSGHGVPAALVTTMVKGAFHAASLQMQRSGPICQKVNHEIYRLIGDMEYYATAVFCILDLESGQLEYTLAGHHPPLVYRPNTSSLIQLESPPGFFLGVLNQFDYGSTIFQLEPGDRLILFTDGILEAKRNDEEQFGEDRLHKFLRENGSKPMSEMISGLVSEVDSFASGRSPDDDRAILCVDFAHASSKTIVSGL